ncbi:MAG: diguanylate cyclase [Lentisphaerae bacterium]|nr:diguanylate cyclase [Lentisphaerota bacterium]
MKVCIPVSAYRGLDSPVHGHFGSANCFCLVDTDTMTAERVANHDLDHVHGACNPLKALAGANPQAVLVGGIGPGALIGLRRAGITVCRAAAGTAAQAVRLFMAGKLEVLDATATCAGHGGTTTCTCAHEPVGITKNESPKPE